MTAKDKLPRSVPDGTAPRFNARESWRIFGIMAEFVEATERLAAIRPEQLQVVLYKSALVTFGAVLGYWIDRGLFGAQDRPHKCAMWQTLVAAWLRRALITLACILGLTLGL